MPSSPDFTGPGYFRKRAEEARTLAEEMKDAHTKIANTPAQSRNFLDAMRGLFRWAVNAGATVAELEAIFGWQGGAMASLYTRSADRRRLSKGAMYKLAGENG